MLGQLSSAISLADHGLYNKLMPLMKSPNGRVHQSDTGVSNTASQSKNESFAIFNAVLKHAYQKMVFNPQAKADNQSVNSGGSSANPKVAQYATTPAANEKISARQAAGNILKFITQRIQSDAAGGADKEALLSRLEAGASGFEKGFNEAKDHIKALNLLTPELEAEITDTYNLVTQGIENLRGVINGENNAAGQETDGATAVGTASTQPSNILVEGFKESNFSLQLTTRDGDVVTVEINRTQQTRLSATGQSNGSNSSLQVQGERLTSNSFELVVSGELDEKELTAITQLLEEIDAISSDFYQGNLQQAFNSAKELTLDKETLSSLNLELKQTKVVKAIASYQAQAISQNEIAANESGSQNAAKTLGELLDSVSDIVKNARTFAQPFKLLETITNHLKPLDAQVDLLEHEQTLGLDQLFKELAEKFDF